MARGFVSWHGALCHGMGLCVVARDFISSGKSDEEILRNPSEPQIKIAPPSPRPPEVMPGREKATLFEQHCSACLPEQHCPVGRNRV